MLKITLVRVAGALIGTVGIVSVSAGILITSLNEGSALAIGSMASAARLVGDATLAADLKRMNATDRSLVLSQRGLASEAALASRMADTRGRMNAYTDRQEHARSMVSYSSRFLYAALFLLGVISLKVALILGGKRPPRGDGALA